MSDNSKSPADIVKGMEERLERDLATWIFQQPRKLTEDIDSLIVGEVDIDEDSFPSGEPEDGDV